MSVWDQYPSNYRAREVGEIVRAVSAGECVSVVGLSGSGKSNLLGFLAHGWCEPPSAEQVEPRTLPLFVLVDCNRLVESEPMAFFRLVRRSLEAEGAGVDSSQLGDPVATNDELAALEATLTRRVLGKRGVCLLLDRFDALSIRVDFDRIASNLRALRDAHKYWLTYVIATRRPIGPNTELAELFFGHTLWLGALAKEDALWSAQRDAGRFSGSAGRDWDRAVLEKLVELTWGYPSLLRAACEAYAAGSKIELEALRQHPAITRRVAEFWADKPDQAAIVSSGLHGHPLLEGGRTTPGEVSFDTSQLTAKENLLLQHFLAHTGEVCEKDDLVRAVWTEDVIFEQGIRDESLAQLVRRLRVKIEPDASQPRYIQTVPGRGYLLQL